MHRTYLIHAFEGISTFATFVSRIGMQEDDEYRAFHGLPIRTYEHGPLRPQSARKMLHEQSEHNNGGQRQKQVDLASMHVQQPGISFLLDDTGHWIDPEVSESRRQGCLHNKLTLHSLK